MTIVRAAAASRRQCRMLSAGRGLSPLLLLPALVLALLASMQPARAEFHACSINIQSPPSASVNCIPRNYGCSAKEYSSQSPDPMLQKPNPGLAWSKVDHAASYTVVMEDSTMTNGAAISFVQWIVQGIPANVTSIPSGSTTHSVPGTETLNSAGVPWYACPCTGFSTYRFWVFAVRAGAPVVAPPTDYFANATSAPRSSLIVLAEVAASSLACTMITAKYDKPLGGAACIDPAATACVPSTLTSTACDVAVWGQPSVWALPAYFYTMRINVAFSNVAVFKHLFIADMHRQLNVSVDRLVFSSAPAGGDSSRAIVTFGIVESTADSDEPDAATAAALFLSLAARPAAPEVQVILSPGATTVRDSSFPLGVNTRYACVHQIPAPFVDDAALCSAPSYVAPAPPAPAVAARGTAVGRTVTFKLSHVAASGFSRAKFNAAVVRTLGLVDASMFELDVSADVDATVSVLFRYAIFGSEKAAQDAAALLLSQATLTHSLLTTRLVAAGMPIDANTPVVAAVAFSCGDGTTSASPACARAPAAPSSVGLSTGHVVGLVIAGCVFGAFLAGFGVFMHRRAPAVSSARVNAANASVPYHELSMDPAGKESKARRGGGHAKSDRRRPDSSPSAAEEEEPNV